MTVCIRHALPSDQAFLEETLYQSLYVPEGHQPFAREVTRRPELARYVEDWGKVGDLALIATDTDRGLSVGAVWLRLLKGEAGGYGYVDDRTPELGIAVLPDYRGQGVGRGLLGHLFRNATTYAAISLSVSKGNPAINLYQKLEFRSVHEDDTSVIMLKNLH